MGRALALTVSLAASLMIARPGVACPVTPRDLDGVSARSSLGLSLLDEFASALGPTEPVGRSHNRRVIDGNYLHAQTVNPAGLVNFGFARHFDGEGFSGLAGWRFKDAARAGGKGTASDFDVMNMDGQLIWMASLGGSFGHWHPFEPITFFFVSISPRNCNPFPTFPRDPSSPQELAPVPEPGTVALFGSGLVALFTSLRRRRNTRL